MSEQAKVDLVTINIDGESVEVPKGMNVIEAVKSVGKGREVPHYCYHPKLTVAGNCRMCMVELGMPMRDRATGEAILEADGSPKISWMPKPTIGCATNASQGMHIKTKSEVVEASRNGVTEFLLINHPLDCPICDQAGECRLQEFSAEHGRGYSRFTEDKNVKPKRTQLGPRVTLDDERCILCSRCVRFSKEVVDDDVLGFVDRGSYSTLTCYPGKELNHNYSLNTVDICPVGALTSTDFRFKMRVWFLKRTASICTESSVGANTEVWSREGKIYRITPRRNDVVNDTWMTDSGRALFKAVTAEDRILHVQTATGQIGWDQAISLTADLLNADSLELVASAHSSFEEQYYYKKLAQLNEAPVTVVGHYHSGDGLLQSEDRSPNLRGALIHGLIDEVPRQQIQELATRIESGAVKALLVVGEDLIEQGVSREALEQIDVIYVGTHHNATSRAAKLVIPALTVFEKDGCFVNQNFRLQRFKQAIPGPNSIISELEFLSKLLAQLQGEAHVVGPDLRQTWERIAQDTLAIEDAVSWHTVPEEGLQLNFEQFAAHDFVESKNLKYDPKAFIAAAAVALAD
jgi:NADH-quinone oxidoreductase subunit G